MKTDPSELTFWLAPAAGLCYLFSMECGNVVN